MSAPAVRHIQTPVRIIHSYTATASPLQKSCWSQNYFVYVSEETTQTQHEDFPSINAFIQESSDQETNILKMTVEFIA